MTDDIEFEASDIERWCADVAEMRNKLFHKDEQEFQTKSRYHILNSVIASRKTLLPLQEWLRKEFGHKKYSS